MASVGVDSAAEPNRRLCKPPVTPGLIEPATAPQANDATTKTPIAASPLTARRRATQPMAIAVARQNRTEIANPAANVCNAGKARESNAAVPAPAYPAWLIPSPMNDHFN